MYNRIYKYLLKTKFYTPNNSVLNLAIQLTFQLFSFFNQIFGNNLYTLGVFTDRSKAFDTIDHTILLKKLKLYSIGGNNHNWTKSFPSNRKQCIEIDPTTKVSLELVKYGIPQGSVLAHSYFFFMCQ